MSLTQLHYASASRQGGAPATPGADAPPPAGFTAVGAGTPQALLAEAAPLLGYEPPDDAPARPTEAELGRFPVAFSLTALSDGSRLLSRAVRTGTDPHSPAGAFHAHAVHLPDGARLPDDTLPISTWASPQWMAKSPESGIPQPIAAFTPSGRLGKNDLIAFAASRAPWLPLFFSDVRALSENDDAPHLVLVERDTTAVARWIALACAVLPRHHAHRLTFTTYTRHPDRSPHRIVGVLPEDAPADGTGTGRHRMYDSTTPPPAEPVTDTWAQVCADIWTSGAPGLFKETADDFDAGRLAAAAVRTGVTLTPDGRTASAQWALEHASSLDAPDLDRLVATLSTPHPDRTPDESTALIALHATLRGRTAHTTLAPLTATVLTEAVRTPGLQLPTLHTGDLNTDLRERLAARLATDLRTGITDGSQPVTRRPMGLLHIADVLDVDCEDLLPDLAERVARALFTEPDTAYTRDVRDALESNPALRTALIAQLDRLAADDPRTAAHMLTYVPLSVDRFDGAPHLRICTGPLPDGDRITALHALLRSAGVSPFTEPRALRTATTLIWPDAPPTGGEAAHLLGETGSDAHRTAGTWRLLVRAALESHPADPDAPRLATDVLRCFPEDLTARERSALRLLTFTAALGTVNEGADWVQQATELRAAAIPVEPGLAVRLGEALAHRLLADDKHPAELYGLARSGDSAFLDAYADAAGSALVTDRLRTSPGYVAVCFTDWSSHPGTDPLWDRTRNTLLTKTLRPAVRSLPQDDIHQVESDLAASRQQLAEEFRTWNRRGPLTRLTRRLKGKH